MRENPKECIVGKKTKFKVHVHFFVENGPVQVK